MQDARKFFLMFTTTAVLVSLFHLLAGTDSTPSAIAQLTPPAPATIQVNLQIKILTFQGKDYPVAIGAPETPTPTGDFRVIEIAGALSDRQGNILAQTPVLAFKRRDDGMFWAIHGGNALGGSQGTTEGCVRLDDWAMEAIAPQVSIGDTIQIRAGQPDTAAIALTPVPKIPDWIQATYYDVVGDTEQAIAQQLATLGPRDPVSGRGFHAYTRWNIHPQWQVEVQADGQCKLSGTVIPAAAITLPRWQALAGTDAGLQQKWSRYIAALVQHEINHALHGEQAANEAKQAGVGIIGQCAQIADLANASTAKAVQRWAQADKDYDQRTNHGAIEGAVFP